MNNSTLNPTTKRSLTVVPQGEREIVLTRTFNAPRALVFEALSQPQHIRRWWGQSDDSMNVCEMDFREGGSWRFVVHGPQGEHGFRGEYREISPALRIVQTFEWEGLPGHISLETLSLAERDRQTVMTILCLFDSPEDRDGMLGSGMEEGAGQSYDRLEALLGELKAQEGLTPTLTEKDVFLTREIDAPRELVWRAFTQAEHLAKWWGPKGCSTRVLQLDLQPGGLFHYAMETPGGNMYGCFVYRDIVAPERITFVLSFADADTRIVRAPFSETWPLELLCQNTFTEVNGKTLITMASTPLGATDAERASFEQGRAGLKEGTGASLDALDAYLTELQS